MMSSIVDYFFNNKEQTEVAIQKTAIQTLKQEHEELQNTFINVSNQFLNEVPLTESMVAAVGAKELEKLAKKLGNEEKAKHFREMREELLYRGPARREAEEIDAQRMIGEITKKINTLIHAVEHDEGEVHEEKYPEMVANICWDIEHLQNRISYECYKKQKEKVTQILEEKKTTSIAAKVWLDKIKLDKLFHIC